MRFLAAIAIPVVALLAMLLLHNWVLKDWSRGQLLFATGIAVVAMLALEALFVGRKR